MKCAMKCAIKSSPEYIQTPDPLLPFGHPLPSDPIRWERDGVRGGYSSPIDSSVIPFVPPGIKRLRSADKRKAVILMPENGAAAMGEPGFPREVISAGVRPDEVIPNAKRLRHRLADELIERHAG